MDTKSLEETIETLSDALGKITIRINEVSLLIEKELKSRQQYIRQTVEKQFLPDLGAKSLARLRQSVPQFVAPYVISTFNDHRKLFGIIPRPGTAAALTLMRAKLANYLDQNRFGKLVEIHTRLEFLEHQQETLNRNSTEVSGTIALLEKAWKAKLPVPEDVLGQMQYWKSDSQTAGRRQPAQSNFAKAQQANSNSYSSVSDDTDWWLYAFTGIPTSARTWFLSALSEDHHRNDAPVPGGSTGYDGGGASGDWSSKSGDNLAAAAGFAAIATDDSLGRYS